MRKRRIGEVVCRCAAYRFPHRQMGGQCTGGQFVEDTFETRRACRDCTFLDKHTCQVVDGQEPYKRCPALEEHIRFNGIRIYGVNK